MTESEKDLPSVVEAILNAVPDTKEIWLHGSRATGKNRPDSDWDILVVVNRKIVGKPYIDIVFTLKSVQKTFIDFDIQPTHPQTHIHQLAQEEGRKLWPV